MTSKLTEAEAEVKKCYSTWGDTYFDNWYGQDPKTWPGHVQLIKDILVKENPSNLLDAGCGPASVLRILADLDIDLYGFDLTPEMVSEARSVMAKFALPENHLWQGSVLNPDDFMYRAKNQDIIQYDSLISIGVLPHIPDGQDEIALLNIRRSLKPGGTAIIEARNSLFSLFTLNRYSWDFMLGELIKLPELEKLNDHINEPLSEALATLQKHYRLDLPPVRGGNDEELGYDEITSRTHVPFELVKLAKTAGFKEIELKFYHHHALPPMLTKALPELSKHASLEMTDPDDWRGYFMASAFLLIAKA